MVSKIDGQDSSPPGNEGLNVEQTFKRLLASKAKERRRLASLPFEEKFRIVASMRQMSDSALRKK
jgi:hypothetical protein